jgi:hypothetical protein
MNDLNEQIHPGNSENTRTGWDNLAIAQQRMERNQRLWLSAMQRRDMDAVFWCRQTQFWKREVDLDLFGS